MRFFSDASKICKKTYTILKNSPAVGNYVEVSRQIQEEVKEPLIEAFEELFKQYCEAIKKYPELRTLLADPIRNLGKKIEEV